MKLDTVAALDGYLSALGPVHLYIVEYRITHSYLHVLLAGDEFHDARCNLYMTDCMYISGPPAGGLWRMRAAELQEAGQVVTKLYEETGRFFATALRIHVVDKAEPQHDVGS